MVEAVEGPSVSSGAMERPVRELGGRPQRGSPGVCAGTGRRGVSWERDFSTSTHLPKPLSSIDRFPC